MREGTRATSAIATKSTAGRGDRQARPREGRHARGNARADYGQECLEHLNASDATVAVDCTLGYGGHSSALIAALPQNARLLCFDRDGVELAKTSKRLAPLASKIELEAVHANYARVGAELARRNVRASCLLADLGCSSMQIDDPERGFTFKRDGPLDMRMGLAEATAAEFLQRASIKEVAAALRMARISPGETRARSPWRC